MLDTPRCIINDVPWPVATRVRPTKPTVFYKTKKLTPNNPQKILIASMNKNSCINIHNLIPATKFHSDNGECNIKLCIIDNVIWYKQIDLYDRNISYLIDRTVKESTFVHPSSVQFYINEYGFVDIFTNLNEEFEKDSVLYDTPNGLVKPIIGDIVLKIEPIIGEVEASFTMNYNTG
jgi:hypothetical protein